MTGEIKNRQELETILEEEHSFTRRIVIEAGFYLGHPWCLLKFSGVLQVPLRKVDEYYAGPEQKKERLKPGQYAFDF